MRLIKSPIVLMTKKENEMGAGGIFLNLTPSFRNDFAHGECVHVDGGPEF